MRDSSDWPPSKEKDAELWSPGRSVNRSLPVFELERFFNGEVLPHFFKALWADAFDCAQGFFVANVVTANTGVRARNVRALRSEPRGAMASR